MQRSDTRGFTLIEVTIVLLVLASLAAVLLPSIGGFNSLARSVRIKEDLGVVCSMLKVMLDDLGDSAFFRQHDRRRGISAVSYGSYGSSGSSRVASGVSVTQTTETAGPAEQWCEGCEMPASECRECADDCDENCPAARGEAPASVTTQTYSYSSGARTEASGGGSYATTSSAGGGRGDYGNYGYPVGLLIGDGDTPRSAIGSTGWQLGRGEVFQQATNGYSSVRITFSVDSFGDQLIHRDPTRSGYGQTAGYGGGTGTSYGGRYDNSYLETRQFFRWRGPYISDAVAPDPWGNRYMANVFALHVPRSGTYPANRGYQPYVEQFSSAVVCYSAGPDETIDTYFNQPYGWYTGGDDVTVVLAGAGGIR